MSLTCPYCSEPAQLVTGAEIYPHRSDLHHKMFWACFPCGAYVGTHAPGAWMYRAGKKIVSDGTIPLGRLANAELRAAKSAAHAAFDPLFKNGGMTRRAAYAWLAHKMAMPVDDCHIGAMDVEQCKQVIEAVQWRVK